jgi:hypothetical protein
MNGPRKQLANGRWLLAFGLHLWALASPVMAAGPVPEASQHWAFQPVAPSTPPSVADQSWCRNPIDQFILARLEARKLKPASPVSREKLIRRVTFDLIGLPPTPEETDAFVKDGSPDAYAKLIDRLLASPHYGERWARHWLDLVRYAESDGFEHDAMRPHSWRYRDYVIEAFNGDKPYDRFVQEQVAGDELWPDNPEALAATAFNLLGPDMVDSADQTQRRLLTLSDMTDTTAFAFLGITMACARCHNHKSEPITQRDYYSLQAFFAPAQFQRELPIPTPAERAGYEAAMVRYRAQADSTQRQLDALEAPYRLKLNEEKLALLSEDAQLAHKTPKEKRTMEQEGTVQETAPMLKFTDADLVKALSVEDKTRRGRLLNTLKQIAKPAPLPMTLALKNTNGPPPKTFVLSRGDYNNPTEEVEPGVPAVVRSSRPEEVSGTAGQRRAILARWLTSADNPLTARVMVNRIWQHHFGRGIVMTSSNFGTQGARPTHPELLDWLAGEFRAKNWGIKAMHKVMLLSAAYQQSSDPAPAALALDPGNELFSRQNRARLEGEVIRDSLLAISGRLNTNMGGPSVFPSIPADIVKTSKNWTASANPDDHRRRSIYIFARRNLRFPFLEVFDAPDSNLSCPERGQSTTAPQSLTLLNSEEAMVAARATAERARSAASAQDRIALAFRLILGRAPGPNELALAREFIKDRADNAGLNKAANAEGDYSELCRALFNVNAFVYVD